MPVRSKSLPWNAPQEIALLKLIKFHKAHIAARGDVVALWNKVNDDLYKQDPFAEYIVDCYKQGDLRRIREKFAKNDVMGSEANRQDFLDNIGSETTNNRNDGWRRRHVGIFEFIRKYSIYVIHNVTRFAKLFCR